jgi:myosin heavy subunit
MTEKVTHKVEDQEVTVFANEEDEQAPSQPFKTFNSKNEHDAYLEAALKERLERKDRKLAEEKEKTEREAREAALKDQENWKQLAEERTNTITEKDKRIEELQSLEGERDTHKERAETLEARLSGLIKPQLEAVPELFRADMPVEKQAEWLEANAEKLGAPSGVQKPAGSRPTGRPQTPPKAEADKEARERQRQARVSAI